MNCDDEVKYSPKARSHQDMSSSPKKPNVGYQLPFCYYFQSDYTLKNNQLIREIHELLIFQLGARRAAFWFIARQLEGKISSQWQGTRKKRDFSVNIVLNPMIYFEWQNNRNCLSRRVILFALIIYTNNFILKAVNRKYLQSLTSNIFIDKC